jgi:hypothetical protein
MATAEPVHNTEREAIDWVMANSDHLVFVSPSDGLIVRAGYVDGKASVLVLKQAVPQGTDWYWYWESMREVRQ